MDSFDKQQSANPGAGGPLKRAPLLTAILVLLGLIAIAWLGYQFWRLLWQPAPLGAIDLRLRHTEVNFWFSGAKVYGNLVTAVYPPASYAILWPFLGWVSWSGARLIWAVTTLAGTIWLIRLSLLSSLADTAWQRAFVVLLILSLYATGATIGNGQLLLHILPAMLAALLLLESEPKLSRDLLAAALFIFALVKPSVAAPFFWIVLLRPGRWRPGLLVLTGYLSLTLLAAACQPETPFDVMRDWAGRAAAGVEDTRGGIERAASGLPQVDSSAESVSESAWEASSGPQFLKWQISILILLASGAWFYAYRRSDLWLLMAIAAFVARFWTLHRWYDDLLLLLPLITLFRIGRRHENSRAGSTARLLFALMALSLLAPGGLYLLQGMWKTVYLTAQTLVWSSTLIFLLWFAWQHRALEIPAPAFPSKSG